MTKYFIVLVLFLCLKNVSCERGRNRCCNGKESITTVSGTHAPKKVCSGDLIFNENFDKFDLKKWKHENTLAGGGNWEFQWYTNNRSNSFVKDGRLYIKPTLTSEVVEEDKLFNHTLDINGYSPATYCTDHRWYGCIRQGAKGRVLNPVRSAKISTMNSFAFKYGRMKVRAKMPLGDWLRPAIWMLPLDDAYGPWPGSGTIVVAECRANPMYKDDDGVNIGVEHMEMNLHWGPDVTHDGYDHAKFTKQTPPGKGWDKEFHDYEMEWTPDYIKFLIDDELISYIEPTPTFWDLGKFDSNVKNNPYTSGTKMAPFDEEFYLILNLAVGGVHYWKDNGNVKPWSNIATNAMSDFWSAKDIWLSNWKLKEGDTAAFQIEYVKIWAI